MKTLIKTTIIASALFTSSLMAATAYESDSLSHTREGIMNYGVAESMVTRQGVDFDQTLALHPVEGFYISAPISDNATQTHCLNVETFAALDNHPTEGVMGAAKLQC